MSCVPKIYGCNESSIFKDFKGIQKKKKYIPKLRDRGGNFLSEFFTLTLRHTVEKPFRKIQFHTISTSVLTNLIGTPETKLSELRQDKRERHPRVNIYTLSIPSF